MASRRTSLSDYADLAIAREIDSKYDDVRIVADNIGFITSVAEALGNTELLDKMNAVLEEPFKTYLISLGMMENEIGLVASLETQINTIVNDRDAILAMYQAIPNINEVLSNIQQIKDLAEELSSVTQISAIVDDIVAVSSISTEVVLVGSNIPAILATPALANQIAENIDEINTSIETVTQQIETIETTLNDLQVQTATSAAEASASASVATAKAEEANLSSVSALNSEISASASATSAASSLASVQSIFDSFDDRYLGAKEEDPTVDNDGDALSIGMIYWNSPAEELRFYNGVIWETPVVQAATSAAAALASETSALASKNSASVSAADALAHKLSAEANASSATASMVSASNSATAAANSAVNASNSADSALASAVASDMSKVASENAKSGSESVLAEFNNKYLGAKSSDPMVSNTGGVLVSGMLYWNTTSNVLKVYRSNGWVDPVHDAEVNATASAASATASANSTAQALGYRNEAANSALAASSSESAAEASASEALNYANIASGHSTDASVSALTAETAKAGAESILDVFRGLYLGPKLSDPTVDNNGDMLQQGALYYNVGGSPYQLKVWSGTEWDVVVFNISGAVVSFNGREGAITLTKSDVVSVLGFDPENIDQTVSTDSDVEFASIQLGGAGTGEGLISWNEVYSSAQITMGNGVTLGVGEELYYPKMTVNGTASVINEGTPVMFSSNVGGVSYITPAIANGSIPAEYYIGIATEDIAPTESGRIVYFGSIHDLDTSMWPAGTILYVSESTAGGFTAVRPNSPNLAIMAAIVTYSDVSEGKIFVRYGVNPIAENINYNNNYSELLASNVQSAIDELQLTKADLSTLSSNLTLYPTTVSSNIVGYSRMVTSITDSDYNDTAVNVHTGAITASGQMVGQLISDPGIIIGNPGILNITTIGNIAKISGNSSSYAQFYFKIYQRTQSGVEILINESSHTPPVNPVQLNVYQEFSASAILNNGVWLSTDRIVIKYFADLDSGTNPEYSFQFGGSTPVRTMLPVPITVIPSDLASDILVDTVDFTTALGSADNTVQTALETLDKHTHTDVYEPVFVKNTAFNKNFGSSAGTVTQGNDSRVVNGQTAYSWGDHGTAGYLTSISGQNLALADNSSSGFVTGSSTNTFTNKSGLISQWTNNVGYISTETDPVYTASSWYSTVNNSSNWNSAYNYSLVGHVPLSGGTMTGTLNGTNVVLSGYLRGPSVFTIDPAAFGNNTGKVVIAGDLQVDGTTTTINSMVVETFDKNLVVAKSSPSKSEAHGAGLSIDCGVDGYVSISYNATSDQLEFNRPVVAGSFIGNASTASDADTLDGYHGSFYLDYRNMTNTPVINNGTLTIGSTGVISGSGVFTANNLTDVNINIEHNISGVTSGVYGSNGKIPTITVDSTGHITNAVEFDMGTYSEFLSAFTLAEGD